MKQKPTLRVSEYDYLKAVMIILMVAFHLVYFADYYPRMKQFVYTFHMPVFLIISGFFLSLDAPASGFFRKMKWLAVPYAVMETAYIAGAAMLPIREHIDRLSAGLFFDLLLLHPIGPYWYLHTLILGAVVIYVAKKICRGRLLPTVVLSVIVFGVISSEVFADNDRGGIIDFANAMYLLSGVVISRSRLTLLQVVPSALLSGAVVLVMSRYDGNLHRGSIGGVAIVYFVMSFLLFLWRFSRRRLSSRFHLLGDGLLFIGRNTLVILLFSPLFTIISKQLIPLFYFDSTRMLFMLTAVAMSTAGSLAIGTMLDKAGLSVYLFGKDKVIQR